MYCNFFLVDPTFSAPTVEAEPGEFSNSFRIRTFFRAFDFKISVNTTPATVSSFPSLSFFIFSTADNLFKVHRDAWINALQERVEHTETNRQSQLVQPINISPEIVSYTFDEHIINFNELHKVLLLPRVDLRNYYNYRRKSNSLSSVITRFPPTFLFPFPYFFAFFSPLSLLFLSSSSSSSPLFILRISILYTKGGFKYFCLENVIIITTADTTNITKIPHPTNITKRQCTSNHWLKNAKSNTSFRALIFPPLFI